ncbi:MAG: ribosome silencing factor [Pseudomonadales bacterium]
MKAPRSRKKAVPSLADVVTLALEDGKGVDIVTLDVRGLSSFTDTMIVATGNTGRHVNALVDRVLEATGKAGIKPIGHEGREHGEWVLIDYADLVVHVMQKDARALYELEKLWSELPERADSEPAE